MLKIGIIVILIQLSLIHSASLDPSRNLQIVGKPDILYTGKNSLQSFHGTYLTGTPEGTTRLSYNIQGWEIWTWIGVS